MPIPVELSVEADAEIGWRLSTHWQGKGLAREAAENALRYGFDTLGFNRVVAFTTPENEASWGLMKRLGMTFAGEFEHPAQPGKSRRRHVLYQKHRTDEPSLK